MKKILKRFVAINLILIILLFDFSILIKNRVEATAEEGKFEAGECPYNIVFKNISSSKNHCLALDSDKNLWVWGNNDNGKLGDNSNAPFASETTPKQIIKGTKFNEIAAGGTSSLAIDTNGTIWTWGLYLTSDSGTGASRSTPVKIKENIKYSKISVGEYHNLAIDNSGNLWAWGHNSSGQVGNASATYKEFIAEPMQILNGKIITQISAGAEHSLAIDSDGNLWAWGGNIYGQLGNGNNSHTNTPTKILEGTKFSQISAGKYHSLAIDKDGNLWAWGNNDGYQLGNGSSTHTNTPTKILNGTKFSQISAGNYHNLAIDTQGKLYSWGDNSNGQLGNGTNSIVKIPSKISTEKNFIKIQAGFNHSKAIDSNEILWSWGSNSSGVLGNGKQSATGSTTNDSNTPIQITGKSWSVTLETNGGKINSNNIAKYVEGTENVLPTDVTKTGYTFAGWYTTSNFSGSQVNKILSTDTGDKIYYAKWMPNTNTAYKVEHYKQKTNLANYELVETENKTGTTDATVYATAKTTGDYANFRENTTNTNRKVSGTVEANGTLVLKVYYDRKTYNVRLETNGGMINSGNVTSYTYGIQKTLPTNVTKQGYTFAGWHATSSLLGNSITAISNIETGDKIYYAKWERNTFTVTFKDGTQRQDTQTVNSGESATPPNWTKSGYTLTWDTEFTNVTSDLTVNAIWTAKTDTAYTVEHHLQNLTKTAYEKDSSATENKTGTTNTQTTATAKTYTGFTPQPIEQKTISGEGTTVIIVKYNRNTYTITLNPGEGTLPSGSQTIQYTYGEEKELPTPTRPGYDFEGWYDEEGNKVEKITPTDNGDKQLEANWTARADTPYKVIHHFRSLDTEVEGYIDEEEAKTGTTDTVVTAEYKTREGFTKNENHPNKVETGTVTGDGSLILHLYYNRNTYNITYELNGGTQSSPLTNKYVYGKEMILQTNRVTKEGYEFAGWYDNEELTGNPVTSIPATSTGDKTFYAKWIKNIFTVTFKDGTERTDTQTVNSGESATPPNWTKPGYDLSWSEDITNITSDLTVNAIWTARSDTPYKVIHHFRNLDTEVEGYIDEEEAKTGTTDTVVTAEYKTREGFTKNENHPNKVETGTVTGDGNLILHLYYNRNTYNITYELNGGTQSSPLTNKYVYGKEMILQTNRVTKEGYTFAGWYDNQELEGSPVALISATSTGDKTFYAKWVDAEQEYYILSEVYNIDLTENTITKVSPETNVTEFLSKIDTNGQMKVVNARGEEITDTSLVGTGYKLQVTFKGEVHTYEIAVRGDLDGNGKITTTDLSIINQQILHKIELTGIRAKAADTDYNGRLTTTDLSMINQAVLRKITL